MRNLKRVVSLFLCSAVLSGMVMTTASAEESVSLQGLTHTDLFEPQEMLDFGTQGGEAKRHTHGLTLTEMPSGDLFAVWFSSNPSGERDANECRLIGAWLPEGEIGKENAQWSDPFEVYNLDGVPSNNPVAYVDQNGRLWVFFNIILNGQWVSAMPRYVYADPGSYETAIEDGTNPDWHYPEQLYMTVGDPYGGQGNWDGTEYTYGKSDLIRHITASQFAENSLAEDQYVKMTSRFSESNVRYITDSFVVGINNQVNAAIAYLEQEKPYDDEFGQRNDIVIQSVNEGIFSVDPYKSEPSLRDGALWRASGADNDVKTWNPAFRRIGWQTKSPPIEFTLPAGTPMSNGETSSGGEARLLLPLYSDSLALSVCAYTDDYGETWMYSDPIAGLGNIQGTLAMKEDGTIYQYFRSGKLDGKNGRLDWKLTRSESHDYGVTWENIYVEEYLRNDGGVGLDVSNDGKWIMAHNQDTKEDLREGSRASVTLSVSGDEGKTWESLMLDTARQENGTYTGQSYEYPGVLCTADGAWLIVAYTNKGGGPADQTKYSQVMRSTMISMDELDQLLAMDMNMPEKIQIEPGATRTLAPTIQYSGTNIATGEGDLIFRTTDSSVATVDGNGLISGVSEGLVKIIATSQTYGTIGECLLTVKEDSDPGDGGSSSSSNRYDVTVKTAKNGTATVSSNRVSAGGTVTVTLSPEQGYQVAGVTVTASNGDIVSVTEKESGVYTFKMPRGNVTVVPLFEVAEETGLPFRDVDGDDWFINAVRYVHEKKIMSGVSSDQFAPNSTLTRGMIAQTLYAMDGKPAVSATDAFSDVASSDWYGNAVNWAASHGIVSGVGENQFAPEMSVTREQMALILYSYAQYKGYDVTKGSISLEGFSDYHQISSWAVESMDWAISIGVLSGKENHVLDATGTATRAEVAQILTNFCQTMGT